MKLALGTVQFGMDYGVTNPADQTPINGVEHILNIAKENNINTIDTSTAYGNSEQVLGLNYRLTDMQAALGISQYKDDSFDVVVDVFSMNWLIKIVF